MAQLEPISPVQIRIFAVLLLALLLAACSSSGPAAKPTPSPEVIRGKKVFEANCSRCHETVGTIAVVGPSLAGVPSRASSRIEGMDARAYIRDSILNPSAYTVEGFVEGTMPGDFGETIPPEDLDAVIAFVLSLE